MRKRTINVTLPERSDFAKAYERTRSTTRNIRSRLAKLIEPKGETTMPTKGKEAADE